MKVCRVVLVPIEPIEHWYWVRKWVAPRDKGMKDRYLYLDHWFNASQALFYKNLEHRLKHRQRDSKRAERKIANELRNIVAGADW